MLTVPSTDGVQLAVHELGGPADAPPLLLCHATGFHGRVWRALADELPDRRCVALDFRGYGDSTEPRGELRWEGFGEDVLAVVDALGADGIDAVGHSKGGAALLLAEIARPGTFRRLVCFEPIVFPSARPEGVGAPSPGNNPLAEVTRHRRQHFDSYDEAIDRFAAKPPLGSLRRDVLEDYVRHGFRPDDGRITLKARREHEAQTYETGSAHDAFAHLGEVGSRVLICHGSDGGFPAVAAPMVAAQLPESEVRPFPDLGHFGPLEDPVAFARVVESFVSA